MMALFYFGCGVSLIGAALAPNLIWLAVALAALGMFAAIYHPVGTAMLIEQATTRGRSLAFNGVCGNLGVAFAAGITAVLASVIGWRGAFVVPAVICMLTGIAYLRLVPDNHHQVDQARPDADVRLAAVDGRDRVRPVHRHRAHRRPGLPHRDGGAAEDRRRAARRRVADRWSAGLPPSFSCSARWRSSPWAGWSRNSRCTSCLPRSRSCSSSACCGRPMPPASPSCSRWRRRSSASTRR